MIQQFCWEFRIIIIKTPLLMSRIIVKNIPTFISESDLQQHFASVGTVTDCKVIRNDQDGKSRRFAFLGFKDKKAAIEAKKKYNSTYMGVSKIAVDFAKLKENEPIQKKKQKNKPKVEKHEKFNQYKQLVLQGMKKSWDDLLVPAMQQMEPEEQAPKPKSKKKQQSKSKQQSHDQTLPPGAGIKAPVFSEKNKKYFQKPLKIDETRLYITNLPYNITEDQIRREFQKYGEVKKIKLPLGENGKAKGFVFVTYALEGEALRAFHEIDNHVVFGRILHAKPAVEDIGSTIRNAKEEQYEQKKKQHEEQYGTDEKTSYRRKKKKEMREKVNETTSWNTLFLNPNTVLERMSKKLGIEKSQILVSDNLAPKMALAEAEVIEETKTWMINNSINVEFLQLDRESCERSKTILLLKNLNYRVCEHDLQELLGFYGIVKKLLLAPNRSIGIVEYQSAEYAQNALEKLQSSKFKNNFLYLEFAPIGMLDNTKVEEKIQKMEEQAAQQEDLSKIVYIKNLNFETDEENLSAFFQKVEKPESLNIIYDKTGKSMGYGFAQFRTNQKAIKVIKKLQNNILDGHRILLQMSKKKKQMGNYEKIKELKQKLKQSEIKNTKLVVRNLAFQATKNDVKQLFKHFGSLKSVRLPKKLNGQHRGFGFVEFDTLQEAGLAKQALSSSHLYGRKLVIEYEKGGQN